MPSQEVEGKHRRDRPTATVADLPGDVTRRRSFFAQVLAMGSGIGAAQAALICCAPILSRMYSPEAFATFALFTVLAHLLSIVASGRYEMAMMLPDEDSEATDALVLASGLPVAVVSAAYLGLAVVTISGVALPSWGWWIPGGALLLAWHTVGARWRGRTQHFSVIARSEVVAVAVALGYQMLAVIWADAASGLSLIAGQMLGRAVAVWMVWRGVKLGLSGYGRRDALRRLRGIAGRYRHFPLFSGTSSLLGKLNRELPKLMLAAFFGAHAVGCFALCSRVLIAPTSIIGKAVGEVFFARVCKTRDNSKATLRMLLAVTGTCLAAIAAPSIILFFWAEPIFVTIFGQEWATAGAFARLLIPSSVAYFVVQPIALALHAFEKQIAVFAWQATTSVVLAAAFLAGGYVGRAEAAILAYSCAFAILLLGYLAMSFYFAARVGGGIDSSANLQAVPVGRAA